MSFDQGKLFKLYEQKRINARLNEQQEKLPKKYTEAVDRFLEILKESKPMTGAILDTDKYVKLCIKNNKGHWAYGDAYIDGTTPEVYRTLDRVKEMLYVEFDPDFYKGNVKVTKFPSKDYPMSDFEDDGGWNWTFNSKPTL